MAAIELSTDNAAKRASGSSFYIGMRLLPPPQRAAMFEIYSFCRAVDDVADDPARATTRLAELQKWRADVDALFAGTPPPRLRGLGGAGPRLRARPRGLPRHHRRHGNGCRRRYSRARLGDARSLLRPGRERRRASLRQGLRHGPHRRNRACPSSRPRAAADQYPARSRRGCRDRPSLSAARGVDAKRDHGIRAGLGAVSSEYRAGLRPGRRARAQPFRAG